ncbi:MAG: hypothetical protein HQL93_06160 [Magnetococcales bacterium]|nr:hypothetical protein [Magnetococcales bacterium]
MKGFLANIGKKSGTLLLIAGVGSLTAACGHTIDPTQTPLTTYEMPAAVVVQTSPALINQNTPWQAPMPGSGVAGAYKNYPTGTQGSGSTDANGYPTGSTVVRQAPITVERPSIVVNQPPVWVGNPPVAIPQPPVVMHQAPITVEQPSFVIQPPKVGFQLPQAPIQEAVADTPPPQQPKVAAPTPAPQVETKTAEPSKKAQPTHKKKHKKVIKKAKKATPKPTKEPEKEMPPK